MRRFLLTLSVLATALSTMAQPNMLPYQTVQYAMSCLERLYVDSVDTDKMCEEAIRAMLKELDPHSTYLTPSEVKAMDESLGGNFEGIGVSYQMENDTLLIINTVAGGPSEKAGVMSTDRIILVNDSSIAGQKFDNKEIQRRLRGPKGSVVKLGIMRRGEKELIDFNITRDKIPVNSVDAVYMLTPTIGYIKVLRFGTITFAEVKDAIEKQLSPDMQDLIIDLQDNGGGYMKAAIDMAGLFLPGEQLVVYTQARNDNRTDFKTPSQNQPLVQGRVVVLIDEESASASEIFAGAIQDYDRGVIVGRRSFGKGLVQRPIYLPNDAMIRLTTSHYYTPSGRCVQKPYTKGDRDGYYRDLEHRYAAGELQSADSIHFADSLRFTTTGGRTVYGGGGIMPDVFVPIDTVRGKISKLHRSLIAKGTLNRYVLSYFKERHEELKRLYPTDFDFINGFEMTDEEYAQLIDRAKADTIAVDSLQVTESRDMIKLQFKAYMANDVYGNGHYVRVMNRINPIFERALAIIQDEEYDRLLQNIH